MIEVEDLLKLSANRRALPPVDARRSIRRQSRLSQAEIARGLGVAATTVSRWETGERSPHGKAGDAYRALLRRLAAEVLT